MGRRLLRLIIRSRRRKARAKEETLTISTEWELVAAAVRICRRSILAARDANLPSGGGSRTPAGPALALRRGMTASLERQYSDFNRLPPTPSVRDGQELRSAGQGLPGEEEACR